MIAAEQLCKWLCIQDGGVAVVSIDAAVLSGWH